MATCPEIFGEYSHSPKWPFLEICETSQTCRHLPNSFARTRQISRLLPIVGLPLTMIPLTMIPLSSSRLIVFFSIIEWELLMGSWLMGSQLMGHLVYDSNSQPGVRIPLGVREEFAGGTPNF
jgi:hypothetical protein